MLKVTRDHGQLLFRYHWKQCQYFFFKYIFAVIKECDLRKCLFLLKILLMFLNGTASGMFIVANVMKMLNYMIVLNRKWVITASFAECS